MMTTPVRITAMQRSKTGASVPMKKRFRRTQKLSP